METKEKAIAIKWNEMKHFDYFLLNAYERILWEMKKICSIQNKREGAMIITRIVKASQMV